MKKPAVALAITCSLLWFAGCAEVPQTENHPALTGALDGGGPDDSVQPGSKAQPSFKTPQPVYRLRLHHLHTGESIDVAYRAGGQPLPSGIAMLDHFLRDHRTGADAHYPVEAFDLLHAVMVRLGEPGGLIDIICGYRSPTSNEFLRTRSRNTGVAENSQHILSHAIDIRVPGVSTERLRDSALSLQMGGVGYYPRSGFVHVDVGPVRQWSFGAAPRVLHSGSRTSHKPHHHRV